MPTTSPILYESNHPFVIRFQVEKVVWLDVESAIPINQDFVSNGLSFTQGHSETSSSWTRKLRARLNEILEADGDLLVEMLREQAAAEVPRSQ